MHNRLMQYIITTMKYPKNICGGTVLVVLLEYFDKYWGGKFGRCNKLNAPNYYLQCSYYVANR